MKKQIGNGIARLILWLSRKAKIDLIRLGYSANGISKSYSMEASGEHWLIHSYLVAHFKNQDKVTFLDVGANKGEFTLLLRAAHPNAEIHSFEPNPNTYAVLEKNVGDQAQLVNKGMGETTTDQILYFDKSDPTSVQATADPEILAKIAQQDELDHVTMLITTLDTYTAENKIDQIDFLKIDTEGFELETLKGAKNLIHEKKISIIQFEFNEVNIVKRRFLADFYELLPDYDFYRLDENRLIPLDVWQPVHEIFLFQNIIAIRQ